jgi:hypothetical protein
MTGIAKLKRNRNNLRLERMLKPNPIIAKTNMIGDKANTAKHPNNTKAIPMECIAKNPPNSVSLGITNPYTKSAIPTKMRRKRSNRLILPLS